MAPLIEGDVATLTPENGGYLIFFALFMIQMAS